MKEAIQKAIEGGYVTGFMYDKLAKIDPLGAVEILLLDPKWWQCLGKALGWREICADCGGEVTRKQTPEYPKLAGLSWCPQRCEAKNFQEGHLYQWHRFIDNLAEGKDVNEFFNELLK